MARAVSTLNAILGEGRLARGGMVQAHGTGTPQNRVTESQILNRVAEAFGIEHWPVAAIKSFTGHSLGAASGDQLTAMLGVWDTGLIPGITTIDAIADDVERSRLSFALQSQAHDVTDYAVINSKGFGGNNASAALLSPRTTLELLSSHHGERALSGWEKQHEHVQHQREQTESARLAGNWSPSYYFDEGVVTAEDVTVDTSAVHFAGRSVSLAVDLPEGWSLS